MVVGVIDELPLRLVCVKYWDRIVLILIRLGKNRRHRKRQRYFHRGY